MTETQKFIEWLYTQGYRITDANHPLNVAELIFLAQDYHEQK